MAVVVMRDHFEVLLDQWRDYLRYCTIRLFQNDHDPDEEDDLYLDYDECDFGGYVPQDFGTWPPAFLNADDRGELAYTNVLWTWTGGLANQVYGYYITDQLGYLLCAERNPTAPIYMAALGQTYLVKPRLTLRNDPGP